MQEEKKANNVAIWQNKSDECVCVFSVLASASSSMRTTHTCMLPCKQFSTVSLLSCCCRKVRAIIIQRRFEALQLRRESNVNERRRLLADKLLAEDAALKQELVQGACWEIDRLKGQHMMGIAAYT